MSDCRTTKGKTEAAHGKESRQGRQESRPDPPDPPNHRRERDLVLGQPMVLASRPLAEPGRRCPTNQFPDPQPARTCRAHLAKVAERSKRPRGNPTEEWPACIIDHDWAAITSGPNADLAEWLERQDHDEEILPGQVVECVDLKISKRITGAGQLFVVSTRPLVYGNKPDGPEREKLGNPVVMLGQVPVLVVGDVSAPSLLVPSGNDDGTAKAAVASQNVHSSIGVACTNAAATDEPVQVTAFIGVHSHSLGADSRAVEPWTVVDDPSQAEGKLEGLLMGLQEQVAQLQSQRLQDQHQIAKLQQVNATLMLTTDRTNPYAICIQALARGMLARRLARRHASATRIQRAWRARVDRVAAALERARLRAAALSIQRVYRGYQARRPHLYARIKRQLLLANMQLAKVNAQMSSLNGQSEDSRPVYLVHLEARIRLVFANPFEAEAVSKSDMLWTIYDENETACTQVATFGVNSGADGANLVWSSRKSNRDSCPSKGHTWFLERSSNESNSYIIRSAMHPGKCLHLKDGKTASRTRVHLWSILRDTDPNVANQQWLLGECEISGTVNYRSFHEIQSKKDPAYKLSCKLVPKKGGGFVRRMSIQA